MDNKKKTFSGCKPLQKNNSEPRQNFFGSYEKSVEVLDELQDTQNIKRWKGK